MVFASGCGGEEEGRRGEERRGEERRGDENGYGLSMRFVLHGWSGRCRRMSITDSYGKGLRWKMSISTSFACFLSPS